MWDSFPDMLLSELLTEFFRVGSFRNLISFLTYLYPVVVCSQDELVSLRLGSTAVFVAMCMKLTARIVTPLGTLQVRV